MSSYSLKAILSTFANPNGTKRTIFNAAPVGGMNSKAVILLLFAMPFIEYALIFNPFVFNALGIAQCIVLYIVLLSTTMIVTFLSAWRIKTNVIKKITPSWEKFFGKIDINMVLSPSATPYSKFFDYYAKGLEENQSEEALHNYLVNAFKRMEEENKELIEAMIKDNKFH